MKKKVCYACDIGGTKLLCGLVTKDGEIIDTRKCPAPTEVTGEKLEAIIEKFYHELRESNPEWEIDRCGMNVPGLADPRTGLWVYAPFSGIKDYPVAERMGKRLGLPVSIENDVNACAWAEKIFGACKDCDDFLWVTVSTGVGGGLVLGGKVYSGAFGGGGEFGHVVVEPGGPECSCGHKGCIESLAAGPAIARRYQKKTGQSLPAIEIAKLARQGDPAAKEILDETGAYIGRGLAMVASVLNLKRYVLGGGVMMSFDLMEKAIRESFFREAFELPNRQAVIVPTGLHYEAGLMGAASLAWYPPAK